MSQASKNSKSKSTLQAKKSSMATSKSKMSSNNVNTRSNKSPSGASVRSGTKSGTKSGVGKFAKGSSFSVTKSNKSGIKGKGAKDASDTEEECFEPPMLRDDDAIQFRRRYVDYDIDALEQ